MNRLSIKLRITVWYTLLLIVVVAVVIGFMLLISNAVIESQAGAGLKTIVDYNAQEVEYDDDEIEIDEDDFAFFKDGVYSIVYDQYQAYVAGYFPSDAAITADFEDAAMRTVSAAGQSWLVYDRLVTFKKHAPLWVRGILSLDATSGVVNAIFKVAFVALPLLVVLAAWGGYWITKRAFAPVHTINRTVESIQEGRDLSKRIALGSGQDEIHELADTYNHMLARLEDSFEAEKQFVSDVSHELRTPVAVIVAQCEYAAENGQTGEPESEALAVIQRQAGRMSRLIAHLLTMTRLEQGTVKAEFEEADISELIQTLCDDQQSVVPSHLTLLTHIELGLHALVDIALIARLFDNLLQNAYKYSKAAGSVCVSLQRAGGSIALRVADEGIGIAQEDQPKIWRRFYQANPARSADESGSMGLGLAMVRQIALLHHGSVRVESEAGKGSIFTFVFPAKG